MLWYLGTRTVAVSVELFNYNGIVVFFLFCIVISLLIEKDRSIIIGPVRLQSVHPLGNRKNVNGSAGRTPL